MLISTVHFSTQRIGYESGSTQPGNVRVMIVSLGPSLFIPRVDWLQTDHSVLCSYSSSRSASLRRWLVKGAGVALAILKPFPFPSFSRHESRRRDGRRKPGALGEEASRLQESGILVSLRLPCLLILVWNFGDFSLIFRSFLISWGLIAGWEVWDPRWDVQGAAVQPHLLYSATLHEESPLFARP